MAPEAAENMLNVNDKRQFASVNGPLGEYNVGLVCEQDARDAGPHNGSSYYLESMKILEGLSGGVANRYVPHSRSSAVSMVAKTRVALSPTFFKASQDPSEESSGILTSMPKAVSDKEALPGTCQGKARS